MSAHQELAGTAMLGSEIPVARIDGALRELWDNNQAATRASLVNFAIYSERPDCLERNTGLIAEITREHACRAILIASQPDAPEREVRSWITAHCQLDAAGAKSVCSEQVSFLIRGASASLIRNIVFAHLDSDLPLVFWWQGDLTGVFEERLYSLINRLIIDSSAWNDPLPQLARLEAARSDSSSRFIAYDLAWARLLPLRLALAGIFDDPLALAELASIDSIEFSAAPGAGPVTPALFLAWMAQRARWKLARKGGDCVFVRKDGSEIACAATAESALSEATPAPPSCPEPGAPLGRLVLRSPRGEFSIAPTHDGRFLRASIDVDGHAAEQLHPVGPTSTAALVIDQLQRGGTNPMYFKLIPQVRRILG